MEVVGKAFSSDQRQYAFRGYYGSLNLVKRYLGKIVRRALSKGVGNMLRHCGIGTVPAPSALHHPHREMCFTYSGSGLVVYNALVAGLLRLSLLIAH